MGGMGWVGHEMWLSFARPQRGLGLLLDTETLVNGDLQPSLSGHRHLGRAANYSQQEKKTPYNLS